MAAKNAAFENLPLKESCQGIGSKRITKKRWIAAKIGLEVRKVKIAAAKEGKLSCSVSCQTIVNKIRKPNVESGRSKPYIGVWFGNSSHVEIASRLLD